MKIRRLNESAEFNFNTAASSGNWPYKMSIETYVDMRDEISQIIDNLDQSSVFAIARDATKLGLSIDEERLYYSPDVTIETNISPEKINQFRSIVMRYSDEQLNEASDKKNENLTESISDPNVDLEIDGFDFEITDTFEDDGVTGYNVVYSKGDTPLVEIEIWEEDSPIMVIDNLFARNLFNRIYDSFDSFSSDLISKASKYCQLTEEVSKKYYVDEIVSAPGGKTETERHSFATIDELKQYCKDAGLTKDDIANCGGCDVKDLYEDIEKLHTKPNGEYLVKADSGKGYTAFSRDNVAIGGIDNEDADSDDKAIDKFKRNEYSECLNEEYFDTAEYRIQKYEDDIPELMAGMHDDYMEGKLAAEFYAEVLKKVYDALAECDHKHTMSTPVKTETNDQEVTNSPNSLDDHKHTTSEPVKTNYQKIMDYLDSLDEETEIKDTESLNEGSEKYYAAKYTAVDNSGNKTVKKICFRCDGTIEDAEKEVDALIKEPYTELKVMGSCLKGVAEKDGYKLIESVDYDDGEDFEYDDDYSEDYSESLDECSGIRAHKVIMGEGIYDIGIDGDLGEEGPHWRQNRRY